MVITKILPLCLCSVFLINLGICSGSSNFDYKCAAKEKINNHLADMSLIRVNESLIEVVEMQQEEKERRVRVGFNSYDIGIPSGITHKEMANVLNTSHHANLLKLSDAFVDAERQYKVNAFALVAIAAAESGWD